MPCNLQGVSVTHIAMHSRKLFVNYLFGKPEGCIDQPRKQDKGWRWRWGSTNGKRGLIANIGG